MSFVKHNSIIKYTNFAYASVVIIAIVAIGTLTLPHVVFAHHGEEGIASNILGVDHADFEKSLGEKSMLIGGIAGALILLLSVVAIFIKDKYPASKKILFVAMSTLIVVPTIFFIGSTVYLNIMSETQGPVHWHMDFRIYACGSELTLAGPKGMLENKVGTPTFHHHMDNRIHVEGAVLDLAQVSIGSFFKTIGGDMSINSMTIPTETGTKTFKNGATCEDGSPAEWQYFLFEVPDPAKSETRMSEVAFPFEYVMKPRQSVPPGDCMILTYGPHRDSPPTTCKFYDISYRKGTLTLPQNWNIQLPL